MNPENLDSLNEQIKNLPLKPDDLGCDEKPDMDGEGMSTNPGLHATLRRNQEIIVISIQNKLKTINLNDHLAVLHYSQALESSYNTFAAMSSFEMFGEIDGGSEGDEVWSWD